MQPNNASSPVPPPDMSSLNALSTDELLDLMGRRAREVNTMLQNPSMVPGGPDTEMPMARKGEAPAPGAVEPGTASAELVRSATAVLVDNGLIPAVVSEMTPELMDLLTRIADATAPGLYDLTDAQQVEELLRGLADGTIPVPPAGQLNAAGKQQPVPTAGGQPVGQPGPLPGGAGGAGAGAGDFLL